MTSFTFSAEQVRSAPPEVRRWVRDEIAAALAAAAKPRPETGAHLNALAACMPEEAARVFELVRGDFVVAQVFMELALAAPVADGELYALEIDRILDRTGLDERQLIDCLRVLTEAFQQARQDPAAALLGFDQRGHVLIDAATVRSIRQLWQQLVAMRVSAPTAPEPEVVRTNGFVPPQLGPSETIAEHQRRASKAG